MTLFGKPHHLWLTFWYRGGLDYALLRNGQIVKLEKGPTYWGGDDVWHTPFSKVRSREIKEVGTKAEALGLT